MPLSTKPPATASATCHAAALGTVGYKWAWEIQRRLVNQISEGTRPNTLLLLEHFPVYTKGRLGRLDHLLLGPAELAAKGIGFHETDRGGQVTYHGPVSYTHLTLPTKRIV